MLKKIISGAKSLWENNFMAETLAKIVGEKAFAINDDKSDYDTLMSHIGESRFVLLGESTHGTHEFYRARTEITKRLILEKNFAAVAVEADFPDAYRVNRFIRGLSQDATANEALGDFERFPLWMWRNTVVLDLVNWLKEHNDNLTEPNKIGFYGLDLYSLHASMHAVLKYLEKIDPEAAQRARHRYSCFEDFGEDAQAYGYAASLNESESCEEGAVRQLVELQRRATEYANRDGFVARDEFFFAEQNARLVKNAEEYYRQMFRGRVSSWNLRDRHMAETLHALSAHLEEEGRPAKIVVWAHNSHLGDARATEMGEHGEWNVGQLVREKYREQAFLLGFTTYTGTVTAANNWDEPPKLMQVNPALPNSFEAIFHETELKDFYLNLQNDNATPQFLNNARLERAIGVVYRPKTERVSHYFNARLAEQFDAIVHFDQTTAVKPLDSISSWSHKDAPETFPEGV
jgi:erythromycin esterase-like protein